MATITVVVPVTRQFPHTVQQTQSSLHHSNSPLTTSTDDSIIMMEFDMAVGRERKYKDEEEFESVFRSNA